jgi:hypothetical protein
VKLLGQRETQIYFPGSDASGERQGFLKFQKSLAFSFALTTLLFESKGYSHLNDMAIDQVKITQHSIYL